MCVYMERWLTPFPAGAVGRGDIAKKYDYIQYMLYKCTVQLMLSGIFSGFSCYLITVVKTQSSRENDKLNLQVEIM